MKTIHYSDWGKGDQLDTISRVLLACQQIEELVSSQRIPEAMNLFSEAVSDLELAGMEPCWDEEQFVHFDQMELDSLFGESFKELERISREHPYFDFIWIEKTDPEYFEAAY
ncbi:hypothetical protein ACFLZY_01720 [Patescibacteria group bacterium]